MELLIAGIGLLWAGPLLSEGLAKSPRSQAALRGITSVAMVLLVLGHLIPESLELGGYAAILAAFFGFILVSSIERMWERSRKQASRLVSILAISGLSAHALLDGWALSQGHVHGQGIWLAIGVLLHRLPMGIYLWQQGGRIHRSWKWIALALVTAATLVGYATSPWLAPIGTGLGILQGLVAGSLLHVLLDHWVHRHPTGEMA